MAVFPSTEADILAAAQQLVGGLTDNPGVFPAPPVDAAAVQAVIDSYTTARDQANAARVAAEQATETKDAQLTELTAAMRADYDYAENAVASPDQLALIGWGPRKTPAAPDVPGIPRNFEAPRQGEGWVFLDWKSPADGGKVVSYQVERRERPAGDWTVVGMALETEIMLTGQERGKDWEYRVIAANKSGLGEPSTTIAVVL